MDPLAYYTTQSSITDPGENMGLFADLPRTIDGLCRVVQGLGLHYKTGEMYGYQIPKERLPEINTRYIDKILGRIIELDERPLIEPRPPYKRLICSCSDFTTLFCAMARHQGMPSRARVGFAAYFTKANPDFNVSHEIAEVWDSNEKRWRLVDAELDDIALQKNDIGFDTHDVPRDQFLVAGQVWQTCRAGRADPNRFGVGNIKGLGIIRGNLIQDLAAQNKMELLNWDCWGLMLSEVETHTDEQRRLLDKVALLTQAGSEALSEIQAIYEAQPFLKVPRVITCYDPVGKPSEITLRL